jgi:hypothetical protein
VRWTPYFETLASWGSPFAIVRAVARVETLAVARFEPIFWENTAVALLDLTFDDGARTALLPGIGVETVRLAQNEGSALFWAPEVIRAIDPSLLDAFEAAVTPWLRTLVRGRVSSGESIRRYRASASFDAARERGDLGAAPIGRVLAGAAPFAFARRFAGDACVEIRSRHAARGAAVLRGTAAQVAFAGDDAAAAWFGCAAQTLAKNADLCIVESIAEAPPGAQAVVARDVSGVPAPPWRRIPIPEPVPMDWPLTFDEADAPAVGFFAVRAADRVGRARRSGVRPPAHAGSAGKIALLLRSDATVASDGDVDEARELGVLLQSIGIDARVFVDDRAVAAFAPDLIHVFCGHGDPAWFGAAARLRAFGVPYVVSLEPLADYAAWEERALCFMSNIIDGDERERFNGFFERRALKLPPGEPDLAPSAEYLRRTDAEIGELLRAAAAVFVAGDADRVRERFGLPATLPIVEPGIVVAPEPDEDDAAAYVPTRRFVLTHGPLVLRHHVLSLVDALRGSTVPLVVTGPVSDVLYGARIARSGIDGLITIADPTPGQLAALYRRATLFVDPALRPASPARAVRAALCGALPLVPAESPLARLIPHAVTYDSRNRRAIRATIEAALAAPDAATALAGTIRAAVEPRTNLERTFGRVLEAYARTAAAATT